MKVLILPESSLGNGAPLRRQSVVTNLIKTFFPAFQIYAGSPVNKRERGVKRTKLRLKRKLKMFLASRQPVQEIL